MVTKQAHYIGAGMPNEYVQAMEGVREMEAFAAVVYSSAFELENPPEGGSPRGRSVAEEKNEEVVTRSIIEGEVTEGKSGIGEAEETEGALVDKAWSGFENVWGKVTGKGGGSGQRPLTG